MVALMFSPEFPDESIQGVCVELLEDVGIYTMGRPGKTGDYSVEFTNTLFSRSQATLTVTYDAYHKTWQLSDSGVNGSGALVAYKNGCQVNGEFIARRGGTPDPVSIFPGDKILIGGNPDMRILVLPECESTIPSSSNPFEGEGWGIEKWSLPTSEAEEDDPPEDVTVQKSFYELSEYELNNKALEDIVKLSQVAGHGLANKETRGETLLTIISGLLLLASLVVVGFAADYLGLNPFNRSPNVPHDGA